LLEAQDGNPHRVRAYRFAARTLRSTDESVAEVLAGGDGEVLDALPGIGPRLAASIEELVVRGRGSGTPARRRDRPGERSGRHDGGRGPPLGGGVEPSVGCRRHVDPITSLGSTRTSPRSPSPSGSCVKASRPRSISRGSASHGRCRSWRETAPRIQ
jgi:hypothetical protein